MFQQDRLAATAGTDDGGDLAGIELDVYAAQDLLAAKALVQIDNFDHGTRA
jgi:hypothetical protein